MYYFYVQYNNDAYLVKVEHCGNVVWDTVSAKREARRMINERFGQKDYVIKDATFEDVTSYLIFDDNIATLN